MHRMNELASQLTPQQLREVEDFAEFLLAKSKASSTPQQMMRFDRVAGVLAHEELDGVQLQHQAMKERVSMAEGKPHADAR